MIKVIKWQIISIHVYCWIWNVTFHTTEWANIHLVNVSNHHQKVDVNMSESNSSSDWKRGLSGLCCIFESFEPCPSANDPYKISDGLLWNLWRKPCNGKAYYQQYLEFSGQFCIHRNICLPFLYYYISQSPSCLTLKTIPSKMSSTIEGKVDSFKGKASVLWFGGLCGVPAHRPRAGVSLSLAYNGLQCTAQRWLLCYLTCIWDFLQNKRDWKLKLAFYPGEICQCRK